MKATPKIRSREVHAIGSLVVALVVLGVLTRVGQTVFYPTIKFDSGNFAVEVESFVESIPKRNSEEYSEPTRAQRVTMSSAFKAIETGDLSRAASLVNPLAYDVVRYKDTVTGRTYTILSEERGNDGSWSNGWGMYVFASEAESNAIVEVVHPVSDLHSEKVGLETFRRANAKYLFISGAHRKAKAAGTADVAHDNTSIFEQIHKVAIDSANTVFQPHGFSQEDHPEYGEVVVSSGTDYPPPRVRDLQDALQEAGFDARLYDGDSYSELAGTTNVQGKSARAVGVEFLHLEVSRSIRERDHRRALLTNTIANHLR